MIHVQNRYTLGFVAIHFSFVLDQDTTHMYGKDSDSHLNLRS